MVLSTKGGAGCSGAPRTSRPPPNGERGSQTLEFALVLPLAVLVLVVGLHAGLLAADLVAVQGLAREAARAAAVSDDLATQRAVRQAAGRRQVRLTLTPAAPRPAGGLVTAEVELESRAFGAFGLHVWLPARASMRVEGT